MEIITIETKDWECFSEDALIEIFTRAGRQNWGAIARTCKVSLFFFLNASIYSFRDGIGYSNQIK